MMNKQLAEELFAREAILVGDHDVIPEQRCEEITGVKHAEGNFTAGKHYNIWGVGNYQFCYYTKSGFLRAVGVMNIKEYTKKGGKIS